MVILSLLVCVLPYIKYIYIGKCCNCCVPLAAQPAGQPEICKMSLTESPPEGGQELFIIGKNFLKGTMVYFREKTGDDVTWTKEASYDSEYFHTVKQYFLSHCGLCTVFLI